MACLAQLPVAPPLKPSVTLHKTEVTQQTVLEISTAGSNVSRQPSGECDTFTNQLPSCVGGLLV